jgi:hydroxymethylbilane synthase
MSKVDEQVLRIGTRASRLAMWQAEHVTCLIGELPGAPAVQLTTITTEGDRILDTPLSKVEGKGFFTKEIEKALLDGTVDLAVHSLKDLETRIPPGLKLAAILEREDPRDVLIGPEGFAVDAMRAGATVGTSSLRRRALLARWRSDLRIRDLRGNVPTRIQKYLDGEYDALVLAAAGVKRLGLEEHIAEYLPPDRMYPAVSQGAVAVEIRDGDEATLQWLAPLDHGETRFATSAERALLRRLEGGCQVPVGGLATITASQLTLSATICSLDGSTSVEGSESGEVEFCEEIGKSLAETLLARGGAGILQEIRAQG